MVTFAVAVDCGAMLHAITGMLVTMTGVQAAPDVGVSVKLATSAPIRSEPQSTRRPQ